MVPKNAETALGRRLLSGGAWALGGRTMSALAVVAANALLARLLSPRDMGGYFLALSLVTLGALLGSLGLNQAIVRFVAESVGLGRYGQTRRVVRSVLGVGALGALGVGAMYTHFGPLLGSAVFHAPALVAVTGLVAVWMVAMTLQTLLAEAFRGFNDIRLATVFGGLAAWGLLVPCLVLLWSLRDQVNLGTVVLLSAASTFASALLAGSLLYRKVSALPRQGVEGGDARLGDVLRVAWPMLVTNLTLFAITQADLWIVGAFRPQTEVAIYGAAAKLVILVAMPLQIVNAVVPPLIAEMYAQGKRRELERTLRLVATVAGIPAFLALAGFLLLGAPLLGLIYGDYYTAAWTVLALLSLGQLVNVWVGSCGMVLTMTGHQVTMMALTVASGMLTVAVGLVVVGRYGATGVAAVTAVGIALQQILLWLAARSTTNIWTHMTITRKARAKPV